MKSQCKTCGRNCEGEYCFKHKPRKPLPVGNALVKMYQKRKEDDEMRSLFLWIWRKRIHFSEISGKKLGSEPLSVFFHHILPKEKYPEAAYDEENIILLTLEEHDNVEKDMYKYEEVNKRRDLLKLKYESTKEGV
jgi:hypothetical protein